MPKKAPTLHDVARLAGVSYQTVSRVINEERYVSTETQEKVQDAIAQLNYRPNRAARSLITRESGAIQIIVFDVNTLFTLRSLLDTAQQGGYGTYISVLRNRHSPDELRRVMDDSASRQLDGILLMMPWVDVAFGELKRFVHDTPLLVLASDMSDQVPSVLIDQEQGMKTLLEHLLKLGHRTFGEITGSVDAYFDAKVRHQVTLDMLQARGATVSSAFGDFSIHSGFRLASQLLDENPSITALVCANDETAFGAMRAIIDRGLRVPQDISVVGFDDQRVAAYSVPPLTTVRQDFNALGQLAMKSLLELVKSPDSIPPKQVIVPEFILRKSTGPVRS